MKKNHTFAGAMARSFELGGGSSNYPLKIDASVRIDLPRVAAVIANDLKGFLTDTDMLPGQCFRLTRDVSYILLELGIRHTVTVGDIQLEEGMYVGLGIDQLKADVRDGYQVIEEDGRPVGKPIDAHAWITLENGAVIDATILASQHRKKGVSELLSFSDAIFYTGMDGVPTINHVPMLTGFVYHQKVLTSPVDGDCSTYIKWYFDYSKAMCHLDLIRMAPDLMLK